MTEDTASDAVAVLQTLCEKTFTLLDEAAILSRVEYRPSPVRVGAVLQANSWRNPRHSQLVALLDFIAEQLAAADPAKGPPSVERPPTFVVFHHDGDCRWSDQKTCALRAQFEESIVSPVRGRLARSYGEHPDGPRTTKALARLLRCEPFYSKEAWLYRNLAAMRARCTTRCRDHARHTELFAEWEQDPKAIDEVLKLPDVVSCVGRGANAELANSFDANEANEADASYAATVRRWLLASQLTYALASTR